MSVWGRVLLPLLLFTLSVHSTTALVQESEAFAAPFQELFDIIQHSREEVLSHLVPRDSGLQQSTRLSYWKPLPPSQRPFSSDEFSQQLAQLGADLQNSLSELIQFVYSHYDIGPPLLASGVVSPTVLPITRLTTQSAYTTPQPTTTSMGATFPGVSSSLARPSPTSTKLGPTGVYSFNPQATDLNVVYYSQTDLTSVIPLSEVCDDPSIDMVIIAFVTELFSNGGYPAMNMASNCWASSAAQQAAGATELLDCVGDGFASRIASCQAQGKKVLLSLGGFTGNLYIPSEKQAVEGAHTLWNLFLGGSDAALAPLRPYGTVIFDGIDLDNESPANSVYLPTLMSTLRQLFTTDASKPYYLSATPQCPRPDASIPVPLLLNEIDFFSVQFYNNPSCQLSAGQAFLDSLQAWSNDLLAGTGRARRPRRSLLTPRTSGAFNAINNGITSPRLLIGAPAFPAAGSGYVDVATFRTILQAVRSLHLPNLAGATFWDGAYQEVSGRVIDAGGQNVTFAEVLKEVFS